ncbi:hypothetical protein ACFFGT_19415 [Mucilaginibacter angelicae]|uniref:Transmembrane family 220 protein n=1 Tax=Mucilaginibacter angelicae TaxID=869718 RepID=A0ABV6LA80_9SPHI
MKTNFKVFFLSVFGVTITSVFEILPWWFFCIPLLLLGMLITFLGWKVPTFIIGFLAGFSVWVIGNLYFSHDGNPVLDQIGAIISVNSKMIIFFSGLVGGLLTGLSLHTGHKIFGHENTSELD